MITEPIFIEMALSFPDTEQVKHFDRVGFKVKGKRMFASYLPENNTANIFLTPEKQTLFCEKDDENIYPVPNKWGDKRATTFELDVVKKEIVMEALSSAYNEALKRRPAKLLLGDTGLSNVTLSCLCG